MHKVRNRIISYALVFICILSFNINSNAVAQTINYEAPIFMNKSILDNKTQVLINDTFTVNYKFQPQDIPAANIPPESYQKQKEIVLVIDTSGSMKYDVNGNAISSSGYWGEYFEISKAQYIANNSAYKKELKAEVTVNDAYDERVSIQVSSGQPYDYYTHYWWGTKYYKYHYYTYTYYQRLWINTPAPSRLTLAKASAIDLLAQLQGKPNISVGIVEYNSDTSIKSYNSKSLLPVNNSSNYTFLVDTINDLDANGGTNIGKGMYKGFKLLESGNTAADKYFIFLTDGVPTYYSYYDTDGSGTKSSNESYYLFDNGNSIRLGGTGSSDPNDTSLNYGKAVGDLMKATTMELDSYFVAFADSDAGNKLNDIAIAAGGNYKNAMSGNALSDIYAQLGEQISSDISIKNIYFEETIPSDFEIVLKPTNMTVTNNVIKGEFGSVNYNLNAAGTFFQASPQEFAVTLKAKKVGDYVLGANNSSFIRYMDINNSIKVKPFTPVNIKVYDNLPPEIIADLSNSESNLLNYTLKVDINEDSKIEVLNMNDVVISTLVDGKEGINTFNLTSAQLTGDYLKVRATNVFNKINIETVPIVKLDSLQSKLQAELVIKTQLNSEIKELFVNGVRVEEKRFTEGGLYKTNVTLKEGSNILKATATNSGNSGTLYFTKNLSLDDIAPIITPSFYRGFIVKSEGNDTLTIFVESNGTGSKIVETLYYELDPGVTTATIADFSSEAGNPIELLNDMSQSEIVAIPAFATNLGNTEYKHEKFIVDHNGYYAVYAKDEAGNKSVKVIIINNIIESLPELL
ncbi:MAG: hypothetical protein CVU84_01290 [Firmicutes bacterium HGW-Firmicutes-1]|jgi:hypothetical protein|nr:MAG: hypothetical protein CVU84_01290 [Firmicutes bacterium HGW-Firmicutes-1]